MNNKYMEISIIFYYSNYIIIMYNKYPLCLIIL